MRSTPSIFYGVAVMIAAFAASSVHAGPFDPAYVGQPNTVRADFTYIAPYTDNWSNALVGYTGTEYPIYVKSSGTITSGDNVITELHNFVDPLPVKYMRIQMFFNTPVDYADIVTTVEGFDPLGASAFHVGVEKGSGVVLTVLVPSGNPCPDEKTTPDPFYAPAFD